MRIRRFLAGASAFLTFTACMSAFGGTAERAGRRPGFDDEVRSVLADKALARAQTSVSIARLTDRGPVTVFQSNGALPLMPASNLKVVTTSAALAILGPDFRFRTRVVAVGNDLVLIGDGDPTIGDPELAEKIGWQYDTVFNAWTEKAVAAGVKSVDRVLVDDSIFDREFVHPNWPANQLDQKYVAQVSGFSFHFNTIDVRLTARGVGTSYETTPATSYVKVINSTRTGARNAVGAGRGQGGNDLVLKGEIPKSGTEAFSVTVHDPALYGATVFLETLRRSGITANAVGRAKMGSAPGTEISSLETPLPTVLARCNKDSCNLYAESLAKRIAAKATGAPGSWAGSRAAIGAWLTKIGVPAEQFELDDGCGLSRGNHVSADAMVRILATDFAAPYRQEFIDSLSIGGEDGTLSKRFHDNLRGRVHAKTGFIDNVSCLSGFVEARNGQWYAFSILVNGTTGVKPLQDRIVKAIDDSLP